MKKIIPAILVLMLLPVLCNIPLKKYFYSDAQSLKEDLIYRMFGNLRGLLADWAFMKSEEYYHGGLSLANVDVSQCLQEEAISSRNHEGHHHDDNECETFLPHGADNLYLKIYSKIKVVSHTHLSSSEEKEVLPWFYLEVKFNPNDIQGYVLGSYWLKREGKNEEAFRFLLEGEKNNPTSAQIKGAIGEIYYKQNDIEKAIPYLEKSRDLWVEKKQPNLADDNYSSSDRGYAFELLADSYLKRGMRNEAKQTLMQLYGLEPQRKVLLDRVKNI